VNGEGERKKGKKKKRPNGYNSCFTVTEAPKRTGSSNSTLRKAETGKGERNGRRRKVSKGVNQFNLALTGETGRRRTHSSTSSKAGNRDTVGLTPSTTAVSLQALERRKKPRTSKELQSASGRDTKEWIGP